MEKCGEKQRLKCASQRGLFLLGQPSVSGDNNMFPPHFRKAERGSGREAQNEITSQVISTSRCQSSSRGRKRTVCWFLLHSSTGTLTLQQPGKHVRCRSLYPGLKQLKPQHSFKDKDLLSTRQFLYKPAGGWKVWK